MAILSSEPTNYNLSLKKHESSEAQRNPCSPKGSQRQPARPGHVFVSVQAMRVSESLQPRDERLRPENGEIVVHRLKRGLKTTPPLSDLKGQSLMSKKKVMRDWLKERSEHPSRYVFTSQKSGKLHRSQLQATRRRIARALVISCDLWQEPHCSPRFSRRIWSQIFQLIPHGRLQGLGDLWPLYAKLPKMMVQMFVHQSCPLLRR
jgi:Phage integrase family